ncbi:hypothetical protein BSLG_002701 [Batrachochytrium salamandrivorans]|nr:hypothetical protein BSLG_002701 [Batrachochytrium salamandrivorans]
MSTRSSVSSLDPGVTLADGTKSSLDSGKWIIGICALDTKARSKPMRNILNRIVAYGDMEAVVFGDKVILDEDIEHWPNCDFLISFFSAGFPLSKAIAYVQRYQPFCINDLPMQELLLDRRLVLSVLDAVSVPTPRRMTCFNGDLPQLQPDIAARVASLGIDLEDLSRRRTLATLIDSETLQCVDIDNPGAPSTTLTKPFVEKPISGEDHNVYIYYDAKSGGGVRKLFRKVGNKSSEYCPTECDIRKDGLYIYEEFMNVDHAEDVKVYTIGGGYVHAETRKSPVVDGIVRRNAEGKEIRYITPLSDEEKEIARRGNADYYENCARIIRETCLKEVQNRGPEVFKRQRSMENQWRLKAYLSFSFKSQIFLDLLKGSLDEVVLKKADQLLEVAECIRHGIQENMEDQSSLQQLIHILDAKATMPGTKIQLKPGFSKVDGSLVKVQLIVKWGGVFTHGGLHQSRDLGENLRKDLLIINKSLLDHVSIYSSSEKRVTATAEIFCKSFLGLDTMDDDFIKIDKEMLDDSNAAKEQMDHVKARLQRILNPENPEQERWDKLFRAFVDVERSQFEPSKISELYDSIKYDLIHNRDFLQGVFASPTHGNNLVRRLYSMSKELFDIIGPHEYGIENKEKLEIGFKNAFHLLKHLLSDLTAARASPTPSTCLYFTKESKIICLLNIVLLCGLKTKVSAPATIPELDYLTQISFELYERHEGSSESSKDSSREYSLRVAFSAGAHDSSLIDLHLDRKHSLSVAPRRWISDHINLDDALHFLTPEKMV